MGEIKDGDHLPEVNMEKLFNSSFRPDSSEIPMAMAHSTEVDCRRLI